MLRNIIKTNDGSLTLYAPELKEYYHSTYGAVQESMHIFIDTGLKQIEKSNIKIFELGYGTGLNFILTYLHSKNKNIEYHGIEAFPLETDIIEKLNYPEILKLNPEQTTAFYSIHNAEPTSRLSDSFHLLKNYCKLEDYNTNKTFDLIYFDAFAPEVQPELWTKEVFQKMFEMLNPGGILTTYCAKGIVRRTMQECGFSVERLPGPPGGKREILRAKRSS